jgi:transcriptional regulator with XRE-family HTH domain
MREAAPIPRASDVNGRIATRVRSLRTALGMTLAELATESGVSRSMLSLVERGESSPTAVVLDRIASGLGVSLATLFDESDAPASPVSRATDRTSWKDPQSGYVRRNISPAGVASPIQIVEVAMPAGCKVAFDHAPRERGICQQIWVLDGTVEVSVGNVTYRLGQDDCLAMKLDQPTAFRNPTRRVARYIAVLAPERTRPG